MKLEILVNYGLGELRFGATISEVEALLGKPSRTEDLLPEIVDMVAIWDYNLLGIKLTFLLRSEFGNSSNPLGERVLVLISSKSAEVTLFGKPVWGQRIELIMERFGKHHLGSYSQARDDILGEYIDYP